MSDEAPSFEPVVACDRRCERGRVLRPAAIFAAMAIIESQQQRLQKLTDIALRRPEVAVDCGAAIVDEIARG